ncbi:EUKARYOTIC TRANSLATION INITIATION FACTOR 3 SUBUNIT J [Salix viminalis]|uniref:EUKARYOTIC TRANSLATION INITIATION FACTOR 3 SUBUNIT J n=1 Tax=Salix viminalis TaxID=40686 RepID=A0A9Q0SNV0_SALVM|nr:EUKARYOTIC TRANSLATION INITIATION FACTOR 3 SUBUNIT J [Salix viminalis]
MEDWEDVQIPPLLSKEHPRNKWDDVKESWEDEDEPTPAPVVKPPPEKVPKKSTAKTTEKKGKTVEVVKEEKLDALAEKLHQQRQFSCETCEILQLVEEADFRSTIELFAKKGDEKSLDSFIPKSESDFLEYAELISHKLRTFEVKREFGSFDKYWWGYVNLKPISTQYKSCQKIPVKTSKLETRSKDMVKRGFRFVGPTVIHSFMQAGGLSNGHLITFPRYKLGDALYGKKKQGGKKNQLHADKPEDDLVVNPYDTLDDYDFMKSVSATHAHWIALPSIVM